MCFCWEGGRKNVFPVSHCKELRVYFLGWCFGALMKWGSFLTSKYSRMGCGMLRTSLVLGLPLPLRGGPKSQLGAGCATCCRASSSCLLCSGVRVAAFGRAPGASVCGTTRCRANSSCLLCAEVRVAALGRAPGTTASCGNYGVLARTTPTL